MCNKSLTKALCKSVINNSYKKNQADVSKISPLYFFLLLSSVEFLHFITYLYRCFSLQAEERLNPTETMEDVMEYHSISAFISAPRLNHVPFLTLTGSLYSNSREISLFFPPPNAFQSRESVMLYGVQEISKST